MSAKLPSAEELNSREKACLGGMMGLEMVSVEEGRVHGRMAIRPHHLASNGFLHAASVVALADTCCGSGCSTHLPQGAKGFTTIELKSNHIGTALEGVIECEAVLVHGGRTTQVWDAAVRAEGKTIALFRCTQMILWPR